MTNQLELSKKLGDALLKRQWRCAVAESCTGGGVSALITEVPGSSQWFERGFVTYTNQSKTELLQVPHDLLASEGAVSEAVVRAMAEGALMASHAEITVAVSGIAGPGGGSAEKPVGLVWFAWSQREGSTSTASYCFKGNRSSIRSQAVCAALEGMLSVLDTMKT